MPSRSRRYVPHGSRARRDRERDATRWRGSARQRGYDRDWEKVAAWRLRESPLCRHCLIDGRVKPATQVDHITRFRRPDGSIDDELRLDPQNTQSLCDQCHAAKSGRERTGVPEPERYRTGGGG